MSEACWCGATLASLKFNRIYLVRGASGHASDRAWHTSTINRREADYCGRRLAVVGSYHDVLGSFCVVGAPKAISHQWNGLGYGYRNAVLQNSVERASTSRVSKLRSCAAGYARRARLGGGDSVPSTANRGESFRGIPGESGSREREEISMDVPRNARSGSS